MIIEVVLALLAVLILTAVSKKPVQKLWDERACQSYQIESGEKRAVAEEAETVRVLILGDTGSGTENQRRVAESSEKTCVEKGCDLALIAGDNFIQKGITCTGDEQLDRKFESMYHLDVPFYAVLGNHDLKGNWRAQIDYTNLSERWNLPGTDYELLAGPVFVQGINTTCTIKTLWPLFRKSKRPWHLVMGHHPVISSGRHGGMTWLERFIISQSGIDFFVSGHNHALEHVVTKGFEQIISGAGGSPIEPSMHPRLEETRFYHEDYGYIWAEFTTESATFLYYDIDGKEIYRFTRKR